MQPSMHYSTGSPRYMREIRCRPMHVLIADGRHDRMSSQQPQSTGTEALLDGGLVTDKKIVFVAFAIEDETQRDFLKGQSLHPRAPYEFIDMSVKEPYDKDWKGRVRTRI